MTPLADGRQCACARPPQAPTGDTKAGFAVRRRVRAGSAGQERWAVPPGRPLAGSNEVAGPSPRPLAASPPSLLPHAARGAGRLLAGPTPPRALAPPHRARGRGLPKLRPGSETGAGLACLSMSFKSGEMEMGPTIFFLIIQHLKVSFSGPLKTSDRQSSLHILNNSESLTLSSHSHALLCNQMA